jgi:phospholipid transport system substrate-binding protein
MENHKASCVTLIGLFFCFSTPSPLSAGAPTEQVRTTVDKVLAILQDPGLKSEGKKRDRTGQLRQVIYARFDFTEMAKRSLGSHWRQRTPQEQQEFVKIFTGLLEKSYVDRMESYNGEKVVYTREAEDKNYAEVDTKIVTKRGEELSIQYKLHAAEGEWKVYDVVIDNISLINNYRSQFNRIITTSSFAGLVKRLKEKRVNGSGADTSRLDLSVPYFFLVSGAFESKPYGSAR